MMARIALVVLPIFLMVGVWYVDRGAVSRLEAGRLAHAGKVQRVSTEAVLERSAEENEALRERNLELQARIDRIPDAEPDAGICKPGCKVQWED